MHQVRHRTRGALLASWDGHGGRAGCGSIVAASALAQAVHVET